MDNMNLQEQGRLAEVTLAKWSPRGAHRLPMPAHHMEETALALALAHVRASGRIRCRGIGSKNSPDNILMLQLLEQRDLSDSRA